MNKFNCIVVLGSTASGKTRLGCRIANALNGEVISADSRQVYKRLNIGTGKDLHEYKLDGTDIVHHLIDIQDPEQQFYLHDFIRECDSTFHEITAKEKVPVIVGGTGLYLDALRKDFSFTQIKEDPDLRIELEALSKDELRNRLKVYSTQIISHVDLDSKKRLVRAIEIAQFLSLHPEFLRERKIPYVPLYIGIDVPVEERKQMISERLQTRLQNGMIEEVDGLLSSGISYERMQFLGLEYKFVSDYLFNKISRIELESLLQTAIFQFAKRQSTWFRKMEKEGVEIRWIGKSSNYDLLISELRNTFSGLTKKVKSAKLE